MKLGAQLYSVRKFLKTEEDVYSTFAKIKNMGYECVQLSGHAPLDASVFQKASEDNHLPIMLSHTPVERIINETDKVIEEHKQFHCDTIGLGCLPKECRESMKLAKDFFESLKTPIQKILDAGLHFAYHNHSFEFQKLEDSDQIMMDYIIKELPQIQIILDVYWVSFAGYDPNEYIEKIGGKRIPNIHYKDMANDEKKSICACGDGVIDFAKITETCLKCGIQNALVEQDNAVEKEDAFAEMQKSFQYLRPIIPKK